MQMLDDSRANAIRVPTGSITRARVKKMKDALQVFVCAIQDQVGACRVIEGLGNHCLSVNLLQVIDDTNQGSCYFGARKKLV